jgi:preprotein translocase subunit YajC
MKATLIAIAAALLFPAHCVHAEDYYAIPGKGNAENPGTVSHPWGTLEQAARDGHLSRLKGGDRVLLGSGYHGHVKLQGENKITVVIEPIKGQKPTLGRLTITKGAHWTVRGLTVSPSCGGKEYKGSIVTFAEGGISHDIVIEDCFVYTTKDTSKWGPKEWMSTNSGIFMGRHGKNLTLRNNYVLNTRFGISLCAYNSLCEANVVSGFSGDGIRITRDGITVQYNVIKNVYVGEKDGDKNHDDAIQCFLFNKGTGTVKDVIVRHNLILNQDEENQPYATIFQAIGFFDGPLVNFRVEDNVIGVKHWHGVSLYDAQNCTIRNNVVFNPWGGRFTPWVMLGSKQNKAHGNTVTGNYAHKFNFKADPSVKSSDNKKATEEIFMAARNRLIQTINKRFNERHPVAGRRRIGQ